MKKYFEKLKRYFTVKILISIIIIFGITFFAFYNFIFHQGFSDGDMFYHIAMVEQIKQHGIFYALPSLPLTSLDNIYINHHLGFHILMLPLTILFGSFIAAKIIHFGGVGLMSLLVFLISKKYLKNKLSAVIIALLPFTSILYISRMSIEKATSIAVLFSLLYSWLLIQEKYKWLLPASFVYVFLYGGWPLLFVLSCIWLIVFWQKTQTFFSNIIPLLYSGLGVVIALLLHPSFPSNLKFYYQQFYKIAVANDFTLGFVAAEWQGYDSIWIFLLYITVITLIFAGNIVLLYKEKKLRTSKNLFFVIVSGIFFLATIKSRRYIEYFVPYVSLSSIILFEYLNSQYQLNKKELRYILMSVGIIILLLSSYGWYSERQMLLPNRAGKLFELETYSQAGDWIQENISQGEIIFHVMWEEFPMLWYHARDYKFISGLDPRFLQYQDHAFAQRYYSIVTQRNYQEIENLMQQVRAEYIIAYKSEHPEIIEFLGNSESFAYQYGDDSLLIYRYKLGF